MNPLYNIQDVTKPKNGLVVCENNYWICEDGDPTKAYFFGDSPQSNAKKGISEWVMSRTFNPKDNVSVVHIPIAYIKNRN